MVNPARQGAPPLEQFVAADEYAGFTKEYCFKQGKNNATNDFQCEIGISNSLPNSGTHATNVGKSGRLSGGPKTYLPVVVGWCWKCMVA